MIFTHEYTHVISTQSIHKTSFVYYRLAHFDITTNLVSS